MSTFKKITSWLLDRFAPLLFLVYAQNEVTNAGATFLDQERCVTDGRLVTAQVPDDLPAFLCAILKVASEGCCCH